METSTFCFVEVVAVLGGHEFHFGTVGEIDGFIEDELSFLDARLKRQPHGLSVARKGGHCFEVADVRGCGCRSFQQESVQRGNMLGSVAVYRDDYN